MEPTARWGGSARTPVTGLGRPTVTGARRGTGASIDPVSMAMHLHASFSEQTASYEAHLAEADRLGVDVVWWTDHDFRVSAYGYRRAVGFDGPVESEDHPTPEWSWHEEWDGAVRDGGGQFVEAPRSPDEPGGALRIRARSRPRAEGTVWLRGAAWNARYSTSLADTTLELDVLAEQLAVGSCLVLEIQSSYHPASGSRPAGRYRLEYRIGSFPARRRFTDGLLGVVECPARVDDWQRVVVTPVDDIAALWPDLVAADNSLHRLRIGVRSVNGSTDSAVVDRLRFHREERERGAGLELRRSVLERYVKRFAWVRQYESLEVSLTRHLNWFGGDLTLPNYEGPPFRDWDTELAQAMVGFMHGHGALASFNHPMSAMYEETNPTDLSRLIVETNALGADIVEIGHMARLDDLLHVFDVAARNAVFFTATGVSDDHYAEDWIGQPLNYLTHAWAPTVELDDVLDALRRGHCWFADPGEWRGTLDLEVAGVAGMGRVVRGEDRKAPVRVTATELPADSTVEVVSGPVDRPGRRSLEPVTTSTAVPARDVRGGTYALDLDGYAEGTYVRAQVRGEDGTVVGVGNPTWLLPASSDVEVPPARVR